MKTMLDETTLLELVRLAHYAERFDLRWKVEHKRKPYVEHFYIMKKLIQEQSLDEETSS
jgi:hypothetical protein